MGKYFTRLSTSAQTKTNRIESCSFILYGDLGMMAQNLLAKTLDHLLDSFCQHTYNAGFQKQSRQYLNGLQLRELFDLKRFRSEGGKENVRRVYGMSWNTREIRLEWEGDPSHKLVMEEIQENAPGKRRHLRRHLILAQGNLFGISSDWVDIGEYWKGVELIVDEVRVRLGREEGVLTSLDKNGEQELKKRYK